MTITKRSHLTSKDNGDGPTRKAAKSSRSTWVVRAVLATLSAICMALIFGSSSAPLQAIVAFALMLLLIFIGVPAGISMIVAGTIGILAIGGAAAMGTIFSQAAYTEMASWSWTVVPMFILMGMLLGRSGISTKVYAGTNKMMSGLPGSLALGTNGAGAALAAMSGSTVATTYTLARAGIPEMLRHGYDKRFAMASVLGAGLPGQLIPPSVFLIVYAGVAQTPTGPQLIAGILPGLLVVGLLGLTFLVLAKINPSLDGSRTGDRRIRFTISQRLRSFGSLLPMLMLFGLVVGVIFTGVATSTEAASFGAIGALVLTLIYQKRAPGKAVWYSLVDALSATGSIFLLILGATVLSRLVGISGLGPVLTDTLVGLNLGAVAFLLLLIGVYLILGMFLDPLAMMLITVPLLLPTVVELGISPLWFGVFVVLLCELAVLTPPVGMLSYILHRLVQDPEVNLGQKITLKDVFAAVFWVLPIAFLTCVILIFFPDVATYLPNIMDQ